MIIKNITSWYYSGFHIHIDERVLSDDEQGLESLERYIICACFSQERMLYISMGESIGSVAKVIYTVQGRWRSENL